MKRTELVQYLDDYLHIHEVEDYGPNGLQVQGKGRGAARGGAWWIVTSLVWMRPLRERPT